MIHTKQAAVMMAAGLMGIMSVVPAWAAGPGVTEDPYHGYGETRWAQLSDNVLEYDELADLIWEFNPQISAGDSGIQSSIELSKMMAQGFYEDSRTYKDLADQMKKAGMVEEAKKMMEASNSMKATGDKTSRSADVSARVTSSTYKTLRKSHKMAVNGAQEMMIGYNTLLAQRSTMEKMRELYSATYDATVLQQQLGTVTQTDVMAAKTNLLSAENTVAKLDNSISGLKTSLCLMTGWSADGNPDIRPLPAVDMARIGNIDLEQDITKAIGNNYTLISQRHTKTNSTSATDNKARLNEEGEQKLRIAMQSLYQDVLQKKSAYESAQTAFQSASLSKASADRQYQLGMTSKLQNLGQQLSYAQAEGSLKSAELDLASALQTYDQAVDGFLTLD